MDHAGDDMMALKHGGQLYKEMQCKCGEKKPYTVQAREWLQLGCH